MPEIEKTSVDEMGRELIFKISRREFNEFKRLLAAGANPNYCEDGNSLLHYLYYYSNCDIKYLDLLLKNGAKVTANSKGQLPIDMARDRCNATELQRVKDIFFQYASNKSLTTSKPGFISYQPTVAPLMISLTMPIVSTINGCLFSCWNQLEEKFPRLGNSIAYVLKPVSLAMNNAIMNILFYRNLSYISSEDAIVFSYYLGVNYLGMLSNQLGKKLTKKIQNIYFKFFLQSLFNAYLTNPTLLGHLAYEGLEIPSFSLVSLGLMLSAVIAGFFFQLGEYGMQKIIEKLFPTSMAPENNNGRTYLGYSFGGTPQEPFLDLKKLEEIQLQLIEFKKKLQKKITDAKLSFKNEFSKIEEDISSLINEINKSEQDINPELYKNKFDEFEKSLIDIQSSLSKLRSTAKNKLLWGEITQILTSLRGIRPLPLVNNKSKEESIPLMTFGNGTSNENNYHHDNQGIFDSNRKPSKSEIISSLFKQQKLDLPKPPTDQELQEMGISIYDTPRNNPNTFAA